MPSDKDARILVIRTGGTIDAKHYRHYEEWLLHYDKKHPPKLVETLWETRGFISGVIQKLPNHDRIDFYDFLRNQIEIGENKHVRLTRKNFIKDSQLFEEDEIKALAQIIINDEGHKYFLLPHGTDAMAKNASTLKKYLEAANSDKVVVFVGSMVPLSMERGRESDGFRNLEFVLSHILEQEAGVYITAFGSKAKGEAEKRQFFDPDTIEKDRIASTGNLTFTVRLKDSSSTSKSL